MTTHETAAPVERDRTVRWNHLIEEALRVPGSMGNTYNRFHEYSFANQVLLFTQGIWEPVATYKRWSSMGRQVKRGSKAKAIIRPLPYTVTNEAGEKEQRVKGFKMVNCLFGVSETDGEPLPPAEPRTWNKTKALGALAIQQVEFTDFNGNVQGFSRGRDVAINPVAKYPFKTLVHEVGHIVLGHTTPDRSAEYTAHRGVFEFQAEATAYLAMHELDMAEQMNAEESRSYIQGWLNRERPTDADIRPVFGAVDQILRAGRIEST